MGLVSRALRTYIDDWRQLSRSLVEARARRTFHVGAAALAVGLLLGMYVRGLAFEYRATWESTFLAPAAVEELLATVLAPGRLLLGLEMPPVAALRSPADGPAAPWIHLFAVNLGLLVVVPRGLLAVSESLRIAHLARRLQVDLSAPYYRRLLARGPIEIVIQPYSFTPSPRARENLESALRGVFGAETRATWLQALEYGEESLPQLAETVEKGILLFNLAQAPEETVQGAFAGALSDRWSVLVDTSAYRQRLGVAAPERLAERVGLWRQLLAPAERALGVVDLEGDREQVGVDLAAAMGEGSA